MDTYEMFKEEIYHMISIDLNLYKERQMKRRIYSLVTRNGFNDFDDYLKELRRNKILFKEFINYLTINVSEFFRNPKQWEVLEKDILPDLIRKNGKVRIWNTACSTGEEPYTLAMILQKYLSPKDIHLLATDIDEAAIQKSKIGVYSEKNIQNVPVELKEKYFEKISNGYKIKDSIKNLVNFSKHNLLKDKYPENNDLILCRNVMIYFTEEAKIKIYKKFYEALKDSGVFFVGSTEQIILPERYNFKPIRTFFYMKP